MKERIQKILSARGLCSRRQAEQWMNEGRVTCNGTVCSPGDVADPDIDEIVVDGKRIPNEQKSVYIMLNKPRGYVTTLSDEKGRPNAAQLVKNCNTRVYPVGRLDMDSEGLLLFTNDGEFANLLMHPKGQIDKTYFVWVDGYTSECFEKVSQPVRIDGYLISKPDVMVISAKERSALLEITIHEGRNRQIRKMCQLAGMKVTRLKRISEGNLKLGDLPLGKWRYLSQAEVDELRKTERG